MDQKKPGPLPFTYTDYRLFLKDRLQYLKECGRSFRQIAQDAALSSPNYLQRVAQGERHLRDATASKVAQSLELADDAAEYFCLMVQGFSLRDMDAQGLAKIQTRMQRLTSEAKRPVIKNDAIHDDWLLAIVWEMASLNEFDLTPDTAGRKLNGLATVTQIAHALAMLVKRGHLVPHPTLPQRYIQRQALFMTSNDKNRKIRIQDSHRRYLDMARHRINENLADRELQGLTIAVSKAKMTLVKERLRHFMQEMAGELANDTDAEEVIRIQCAAFFVTR